MLLQGMKDGRLLFELTCLCVLYAGRVAYSGGGG